jgi:hypothetical protein
MENLEEAIAYFDMSSPEFTEDMAQVARNIELINSFNAEQCREISYWLTQLMARGKKQIPIARIAPHQSHDVTQARRKCAYQFQELFFGYHPDFARTRDKARERAKACLAEKDIAQSSAQKEDSAMGKKATATATVDKAAEAAEKKATREKEKGEKKAAKDQERAVKKAAVELARVHKRAFEAPGSGKIYDLSHRGYGMMAAFCTEFKKELAKIEPKELDDAIMERLVAFLKARDEKKGKVLPDEKYPVKARAYFVHGKKIVVDRIEDDEINYDLLDKPPVLKKLPALPAS